MSRTNHPKETITMPRIRIARIGAAMAGLWFAALAAGQQPEPVSPGGPRLQLTPLQWNFGEVWQGEPLEFELTVASVGDAPLHITRVDPSCGCTTLTKPRDVLNPGESDKLVVKFDAVKRRGPQNTRIVFASDDPAQPNAQFVITGNVKPVYEVKPVDSLSFGKLYRGTQDARTVTITNLYTEPMRARLKPGQDYRPYEVSLKEIEPGRKYEVTARTLPPLGVGVQRTTVMFETGIPRLPEVEIITYGTVHPPIEIETARLMVSRTAPRGVQHVLPVLRDPAEPVRVVSAKASH